MKALLKRFVLAPVLATAIIVPQAAAVVHADDLVGGVAASELEPGTAPDVDMAAGALITSDGRLLWTRDPDETHAMASTTKIMTAVVTLENADLDERVTIAGSRARPGESTAELRDGETYTVRELLEALIVPSGNDAAAALAMHVGGSEAGFVEMMNAKAGELGLDSTRYANAHGLDAEGHYTSAEDLAVLAAYAMRNEEFRRVAALQKSRIDGGNGPRTIESRNLLLGEYVGANGIKTGWTSRAGFCFAGSARRNDAELIAVVLGAGTDQGRFDEATALLDWGFAHYRIASLASAETTMGMVPVADYLDEQVAAIVESSVCSPVFDLDGEITSTVNLLKSVDAPVRAGQRLGTLTVKQGDRLLAQVPVVAASGVERPGFFERVWIGMVRGWRAVFGEGEAPVSQ